MYKLVLLRHGQSEWNLKNLFTGWEDVDLSEQGKHEALQAGDKLRENGFSFDVCFTSYLKRAINTAVIALERLDIEWIPVIKSWKLNERHYGDLQSKNKAETAAKYGEEQVFVWRRSYDVRPPQLHKTKEEITKIAAKFDIDTNDYPLCESLEDTVQRVVPYFKETIMPYIITGKRVIIVAHGNSLRALVKYFEGLSGEEISKVDIPTGIPLIYELDNNMHVSNKYYLSSEEELNKRKAAVKSQGKLNKLP